MFSFISLLPFDISVWIVFLSILRPSGLASILSIVIFFQLIV